ENQTDTLTALKAGKIDIWASDEPVIRFMQIENPELRILDGYLSESNLAAIFPKTEAGQALCDEYSDFIEDLWAGGTMRNEIDAVWFGTDDSKRTVLDYEHLPAPNGKLSMAADLMHPPFAYMKDGRAIGYDLDVAARFCQKYGYGLEVVSMSFGGILPAVQSGKVDFAASSITVTAERAEVVLFSTPNYYGGIRMAMWDETPSDQNSIAASFEKTFIREGRWRLFVDGVMTTLLITILAVLFGTSLGFMVFMLCRNGNLMANLVTRFCLWLVQGMPMVVLLMILYYIIFSSVAISGVAVAVIGFTLTFGASVFGLLKMGVGAVDNGQYEAAYALGYSNRRTFFRIILPQALPHMLPAYNGEIVALIKATAIVGYIAVQDLTKMGDIVRSRTYEAFFPLIAVTVIYFALEGLIGYLVRRISVNLNPKRREPTDILKGIKTDD
ncbi:MAG: transporter substrate-binding domain-containing protein, partial [Clostridia bacterium]|nr:transporter substrate-binding domain-containing protein [Clostridia bacterium]